MPDPNVVPSQDKSIWIFPLSVDRLKVLSPLALALTSPFCSYFPQCIFAALLSFPATFYSPSLCRFGRCSVVVTLNFPDPRFVSLSSLHDSVDNALTRDERFATRVTFINYRLNLWNTKKKYCFTLRENLVTLNISFLHTVDCRMSV